MVFRMWYWDGQGTLFHLELFLFMFADLKTIAFRVIWLLTCVCQKFVRLPILFLWNQLPPRSVFKFLFSLLLLDENNKNIITTYCTGERQCRFAFCQKTLKEKQKQTKQSNIANDCWSFKYGSLNNAGVLQNTFGVRWT